MIRLEKRFRFESAHRLAKGYVGKCASVHGHSWNGHITVECEDLDSYDMGVDYKVLGKFCKAEVEDRYDHAIILYKADEELIYQCQKHGQVVIMDKNPTSEAIAEEILELARVYFMKFKKGVRVVSVTVEETCTTRCTAI